MDNFDLRKYLAEGKLYENALSKKLKDEAKQPDSKVGASIFNKYAKKIENADKADYKKIIKAMESELISKHPDTFSGEDDIPGSFLAEGKLYEEAYNLSNDPDSNTDKYVRNHWDRILKDILRAHTDLRNTKGGENMPEKPSQRDIDRALDIFDGVVDTPFAQDIDPNVYNDFFDFYDIYLVSQAGEENTKNIAIEDFPYYGAEDVGGFNGYIKRDDLYDL